MLETVFMEYRYVSQTGAIMDSKHLYCLKSFYAKIIWLPFLAVKHILILIRICHEGKFGFH